MGQPHWGMNPAARVTVTYLVSQAWALQVPSVYLSIRMSAERLPEHVCVGVYAACDAVLDHAQHITQLSTSRLVCSRLAIHAWQGILKRIGQGNVL